VAIHTFCNPCSGGSGSTSYRFFRVAAEPDWAHESRTSTSPSPGLSRTCRADSRPSEVTWRTSRRMQSRSSRPDRRGRHCPCHAKHKGRCRQSRSVCNHACRGRRRAVVLQHRLANTHQRRQLDLLTGATRTGWRMTGRRWRATTNPYASDRAPTLAPARGWRHQETARGPCT
jgi:hypothetical protein